MYTPWRWKTSYICILSDNCHDIVYSENCHDIVDSQL